MTRAGRYRSSRGFLVGWRGGENYPLIFIQSDVKCPETMVGIHGLKPKENGMNAGQAVYLKYVSVGVDCKLRVGSFRFDGDTQWRSNFGYVPLNKPGQFRTLLCKCGANDWSDNGRFINEYECQSCGAFMEATEWQSESGKQ